MSKGQSNSTHTAQHTGVLQAVFSLCLLRGDELSHMSSKTHSFAFLVRGPLYFAAVSSAGHHVHSLSSFLVHLHYLLVFSLSSLKISQVSFFYYYYR